MIYWLCFLHILCQSSILIRICEISCIRQCFLFEFFYALIIICFRFFIESIGYLRDSATIELFFLQAKHSLYKVSAVSPLRLLATCPILPNLDLSKHHYSFAQPKINITMCFETKCDINKSWKRCTKYMKSKYRLYQDMITIERPRADQVLGNILQLLLPWQCFLIFWLLKIWVFHSQTKPMQ